MMNTPLPPQDLFIQSSFINGCWCDGESGLRTKILNPATLECLGEIPLLSDDEINDAINAAHEAQKYWAQKSMSERCVFVKDLASACREHMDDLSLLLTLEQGKPLQEAKGELEYGISFLETYAELGLQSQGHMLEHPNVQNRILVNREPVGVVAAITPWNFPHAMITRKLGPALIAGCSMVLKPAPETPYSALALAVLCEKVGLPKGLFNVVTGDAESIGDVMTSHPKVRKLSFTGSSSVGKMLQEKSSRNLLKTSLELGGNAPFVVFEDADLDAAVQGLMVSKFRNAGQTCVASNRVYLHERIQESFIDKLVGQCRQLVTGYGWDDGVHLGPLISDQALEKVKRHLDWLKNHGAIPVYEAPKIKGPYHQGFMGPQIYKQVPFQSIFMEEETFGPTVAISSFREEQEVLKWCNATDSGLASYFYSRDLNRCFRFSKALKFGMVGVNEGFISTAKAPFGGIKHSGQGREGGAWGLEDYQEIKYTCIGGLD
jgi:succinate-semialdehyde dehydrogenase/glutarate-semialdehyde dehydrogenase